MTHILILGGGFGGTHAAQQLEKAFKHDDSVRITLVNRTNYMVFTPMLAEVAGNTIEDRHAVPPLRGFFRKVRFLVGDVLDIDPAKKHVSVMCLDQNQIEFDYDYLVIALGSVTNYQHVDGAMEHCFDLKSLDDAIRLRNHVINLLEKASSCDGPEMRRELLTFVAAGGGYAGVEGLAHIMDFMTKALRYYPSIDRSELRFILASHGPRLLQQINEQLGGYVRDVLTHRGVDVRTGVSVTAVDAHHATLEPGGDIPTRTVIWAAGVAVNPLVKGLDLPKSKQGALIVNEFLQVQDHPEIYALGDCASVPMQDGGTYAPTAQNATREGTLAGRNIVAAIRGSSRKPFRFQAIGSLASLGHYQAVAQIWRISLSGFLAWLAWRGVYLAKLPEMSRRIRVAIDWIVELLLPTDIVQLPVLPNDDMANGAPTQATKEQQAANA